MSISYNYKRIAIAGVVVGSAAGISLLGIPPVREIKKVEVPIELKMHEKSGYDASNFAYMRISSNNKELCSFPATTAIRNYFGDSNKYVERTNVALEVCNVPASAKLHVEISYPYQPDANTIDTSVQTCGPFEENGERWHAHCTLDALFHQRQLFTYQSLQKIPFTHEGNMKAERGEHQRNADRFDVLLVR